MTESKEEKITLIESELKQLHETLQGMGKNSTLTTDIFGRRYQVPVDAEHKATQDPLCVTLCNFSNPHMRAFHTSWFGFFSSFYSTFAAAALNAYIIPDIGINGSEWSSSGDAAVGGHLGV